MEPQLYSISVESPESDAFNIWFDLELILDHRNGQLWHLNVVSTKWIEQSGVPFKGKYSIVVPSYDQRVVSDFVIHSLRECAAETHEGVWRNLGKRFLLDESVSFESLLADPIIRDDRSGGFPPTRY